MNRDRCRSVGRTTFALIAVCWAIGVNARAEDSRVPTIDFNRDVRPILAENCFRCHGPDAGSRQAELRLDRRDDAIADRGGSPAVVPGSPEKSLLFLRITSSESSDRMPPDDSGATLADEEVVLLRRWIERGAEYQKHWSFIPPKRPTLPELSNSAWPRSPIDRFVLARLNENGLNPSPPAPKEKLLRRATFDLTGLPPNLEDLDSFTADNSPGAFGNAVDRLLASPRYGEHMAREWLDLARYADTNGYFTDKERSMWHWRDWVIAAYNRNMSFDEFTVEQLAGDLLEKATRDQQIATGFNRNHMVNDETGIVEEEYRVEYVADRLETTATVWLGLTAGCARCHDHKYDPLSQKDFYHLFAYFNNVPERGLGRGKGNEDPVLKLPTADYEARLAALRHSARKARDALESLEPEISAAQTSWESAALEDLDPVPVDGLVKHFPFDDPNADSMLVRLTGGKPGPPSHAPGFLGTAASFDGDSVLVSDARLDFDRTDPFSFGAWVHPTAGHPICILSKNDDADGLRGFDLLIRKGKAAVHLIHRWNSDAIGVVTRQSVARNQWSHLMATYDGSGTAAGVEIHIDGVRADVEIKYDSLSGSIGVDQPLRIGRRSTSAPFVGLIDDVRLYSRRLTAAEVGRLAGRQFLRGSLDKSPADRPPALRQKLREYFIDHHADDEWRDAFRTAQALGAEERVLAADAPTTMVMRELEQRRETFLLNRGQYDQPGQRAVPGVPESLPPLSDQAPDNRLGFARWLVGQDHPLTARVAVNRIWRQFFGEGIVETVEDFGVQGDWPSHPRLLDWLAVEFVRSGWNVKHIQRLIVTSATYRQSSVISPDLAERDPKNRLLGRGPRVRFSAETIRDNALAMSGLLVEEIGGRSVKPYQPKGLWKAVSYDGGLEYEPSRGASLYRRGIYTFWKRQSPPPGLLAFDAPTRETCVPRRSRTNTPMQALVLMNDVAYLEAARGLAARMVKEADPGNLAEPVEFAFRLATARRPSQRETDILVAVYQEQLAEFRADETNASRFLRIGESPQDPRLDPCELAAWTTVASMILGLDETITKD